MNVQSDVHCASALLTRCIETHGDAKKHCQSWLHVLVGASYVERCPRCTLTSPLTPMPAQANSDLGRVYSELTNLVSSRPSCFQPGCGWYVGLRGLHASDDVQNHAGPISGKGPPTLSVGQENAQEIAKFLSRPACCIVPVHVSAEAPKPKRTGASP